MFRISQSQLQGLSDSEAYLERLTARLRGDFPEQLGAQPLDEFRARVRVAFDRFVAQGFQQKQYLHRLVVLELLFGPEFETGLPEETRLFSFPAPDAPRPPEPERFWAVYRASEHLTRPDAGKA